MSYTVFALKWRPKDFEEIVGQAHIVHTLTNAVKSSKLAHAYLFAGPRGVGKTSTARILAKSLNCVNGPTPSPCQKCTSCIEIAQGRSLDVIEIDGASNNGVDNIRELRESVKFAPSSGRFKVYIIDEVHMLSDSAFNALLKTLEEPPPYVKFIFATTHPHEIIPTILSRCQRLDFRRIPVLEIIAQLEKIAAQENLSVDKEVLFAIAKVSEGSLRDAESLLDQLSAFAKGPISLKDIVSVLGIVQQQALFEITDSIIRKDAKAALGLLNRILDEGKDAGVFLDNLTEHFRNLMIAKISQADAKLIDLPQDICNQLLEQAKHFSLDEIFSAFSLLVNTKEMTKRLDSLRLPLEISLVKLAHSKKEQSAAPPLRKNAEQDAPPNTEAPSRQETAQAPEITAPPVSHNCVSFEAVLASWQGIIEALGKVRMSLATFLSEGTAMKLEDNILTIAFPKEYNLHKESLEKKENKALLEKIFCEALQAQIRVNFLLSKELAAPREHVDSPLIKSALDAFGARLIISE